MLAFLELMRFNAARRRIAQPAQLKAQPAPKPVIDRIVMPGMLECYKCKLLCSNKDDLNTHKFKCLGRKVVKFKPVAKAPQLELEKGWGWGIPGKNKKLKEAKRFLALRKGKAKKGKSTY